MRTFVFFLALIAVIAAQHVPQGGDLWSLFLASFLGGSGGGVLGYMAADR